MAKIGTIKQYNAPFESNSITLEGNCIIGVSISEDDYMLLGSSSGDRSFRFEINGHQIWMGRTYRYQTQEQVNNVTINFPDGIPSSTLIEAVYCSQS